MVNKPIPPCKGCKQRVAENPEKGTKDCHIKCEKYQHYREENEKYRESSRAERASYYIINFGVKDE